MTDDVPPPPPARPNPNRKPPAAGFASTGGQPGTATARPAAQATAGDGNVHTRPGAAKKTSASPPPPPKESLLPKSWEPLALPSISGIVKPTESTTVGASPGLGGGVANRAGSGGGIAPADLVPYGEAGLPVALSVPPERLRRQAAEANPFDERLLIPAAAVRALGEAVAQLSNLADDVGPAGREAEVRLIFYFVSCVMTLLSTAISKSSIVMRTISLVQAGSG